MAKKRKATVPFDAKGEALAKVLDVKRRLIEIAIQRGDPQYARRILDDARNFVRCVREGLEMGLRDRSLEDISPEMAQEAIYGCQIFEESLRADYSELCH